MRFHTILRPLALQNCNPLRATTCLLYTIRMEPAFSPTACAHLDPTVGAIHAMLATSTRSFGLLTAQQLPPIGTIKLFQHFGAVIVHIARKPIRVQTSTLAALPLRRAHERLFGDLIGAVRPFVIGQQAADNDYLIVPCQAGAVDANAVMQLADQPRHTAIEPLTVAGDAKRAAHRYTAADYEGAVVTPWYRNDHGARFVVTRVCAEVSPFGRADADLLASTGAATYAEYVADRWGVQAQNRGCGFMLEVRGITQRLNLLVPGGNDATGGGSSSTARRHVERLIPELCHRFAVPADLWLQATMLPSTLHRLEFALHAEELRGEINAALGVRQIASSGSGGGYEPDALLERSAVATTPVATAAAAVAVLADPWSDLPVVESPARFVLIVNYPSYIFSILPI